MLRLFAVAGFALAVTTSAQAITPAPLPQPDGMVSAWPEPPSVIPAEWSAGATAGAITEHHRLKQLSTTQSGAVTVPPMAVC